MQQTNRMLRAAATIAGIVLVAWTTHGLLSNDTSPSSDVTFAPSPPSTGVETAVFGFG